MLCRDFCHARHPVISKRALIRIIDHKTGLTCLRTLRAVLKFRRLRVRCKRQIQKRNPAFRCVRSQESFIRKILRVGQELPLFPFRRKNAKSFFTLRFCITQTFVEQVVGIPVPFHAARNPQAVYVKIALCFYRYPRIFCRNIFDKALASFFASIKDKPLFKPLLEPFFFRSTLFV